MGVPASLGTVDAGSPWRCGMSEGPMKITRKDAFQICPEWVLLADISAQAVRLYLVLSKASDNETKTHHWGRKKIAEAMRLKSPRSVDRYLGELAAIGAVKIRTQFEDNRQTTNEYQVITVDPSQYSARGVADLNTPGGADLNTPGGAENCSQSYNLYDPKTSTNLHTTADAVTEELVPAPEDTFEQWWSMYPVKVGKATARKAYRKAALRHDDLPGKLQAYLQHRATYEGQGWLPNIPHPTTWLNQERWDDRPMPTTDRSKPTAEQRAADILRMGQQMQDHYEQQEIAQ